MKKEFIPKELAVKLKFLGFDEKCFGIYQDDTNKKLDGKKNVPKRYYGNKLLTGLERTIIHWVK